MKKPTSFGLSKDIIEMIESGAKSLEISKSSYLERIILEYMTLKNSLRNVDISTLRVEAQPLVVPAEEPTKSKSDELGDAITNSIADIFKNMKP